MSFADPHAQTLVWRSGVVQYAARMPHLPPSFSSRMHK